MSIKDTGTWMKDKTQESVVKNWVVGPTEDGGYEPVEFRIFNTEAMVMRFCMTLGIVLNGKKELIDEVTHSAVKQNDSFDPTGIITPVSQAAKYCAFGIDYVENHLGDINNLPKFVDLVQRFSSGDTEFCENSDCQWPLYSRGEKKEQICPKCSAANESYEC